MPKGLSVRVFVWPPQSSVAPRNTRGRLLMEATSRALNAMVVYTGRVPFAVVVVIDDEEAKEVYFGSSTIPFDKWKTVA